jgi:hypothetical protein
MTVAVKRALALLCAPALAMSLLGCAKAVSTAGFKGEQREVAQVISNLQSDVTAGDHKKICANDLASTLVARLNAAHGGCRQAIKGQLAQVDSYNVSIQSVHLSAAGAQRRATAQVKSVYSGKTRRGTLSLLKEGGKWKIAGLG